MDLSFFPLVFFLFFLSQKLGRNLTAALKSFPFLAFWDTLFSLLLFYKVKERDLENTPRRHGAAAAADDDDDDGESSSL